MPEAAGAGGGAGGGGGARAGARVARAQGQEEAAPTSFCEAARGDGRVPVERHGARGAAARAADAVDRDGRRQPGAARCGGGRGGHGEAGLRGRARRGRRLRRLRAEHRGAQAEAAAAARGEITEAPKKGKTKSGAPYYNKKKNDPILLQLCGGKTPDQKRTAEIATAMSLPEAAIGRAVKRLKHDAKITDP